MTSSQQHSSSSYNFNQAHHYHEHHRRTLGRRLSNWREQWVAARLLALAGNPATVLDLPCGTGRFWPTLSRRKGRIIMAADNSAPMLAVARQVNPPDLLDRITLFQCSAFDTGLPDESVDHVFCMRLLHHFAHAEDRLALLREFRRVTRDTVAVSLWVEGNYKTWRRRARRPRTGDGAKTTPPQKTATPPRGVYDRRVVLPPETVEGEFEKAGFAIIGHVDFLKYYAMWRSYALKKQAA